MGEVELGAGLEIVLGSIAQTNQKLVKQISRLNADHLDERLSRRGSVVVPVNAVAGYHPELLWDFGTVPEGFVWNLREFTQQPDQPVTASEQSISPVLFTGQPAAGINGEAVANLVQSVPGGSVPTSHAYFSNEQVQAMQSDHLYMIPWVNNVPAASFNLNVRVGFVQRPVRRKLYDES